MTRRNILKRWVLFGLLGGLSYPLFSFWKEERYRPPIKKRVSRWLKPGEFLIEPEFLLLMAEDGPIAISRKCTHLGCRVNFLKEKGEFLCPCHQSRFTKDGKYISGPAKKDLKRYKVKALKDKKGFIIYMPR